MNTRPRFLTSALLAIPLLGLSLLVGCSDDSTDPDDDEEEGHPPAEMVGSWTFVTATENGAPVALADALEWTAGAVAAKFHFQENGAYVYEEVNGTGGQLWFESGWVFVDPEGETIEVNVQLDSDGPSADTSELTYMIQGTNMTLQQVEGGSTFRYLLTR